MMLKDNDTDSGGGNRPPKDYPQLPPQEPSLWDKFFDKVLCERCFFGKEVKRGPVVLMALALFIVLVNL